MSAQSASSGLAPFQGQTTLVVVDTSERTYALNDSLLVPGRETVHADSLLLVRDLDYRMDYLDGILKLARSLPTGTRLKVRYEKFPFALRRHYFRRPLVYAKDEDESANGSGDRTPVYRPKSEDLFASRLRKNGSLIRGISVGTNQGLRVDSGLRMQISGQLTDDVEVVASLTDQNTPIQPEGNTQSLQEIDKVFVQIKSPNVEATLGDYNLHLQGTEFTRYSRKLQGVMGTATYDNWKVTASGAVSRGQFTTNQFLGQEGNQGPYQLRGQNGEINIIVLAGTERVWVDGELMTRGENNDYVIEYGNGQITFTRNRLITADSRITVDFQYSDESFQRNLWGFRGETTLLGDKLALQTTYLRESDDKDNPLNLNLTGEFLGALEAAGDTVAVIPGDTLVGPGRGNYIRDSTGVFIYVGPNAGDYNVSFTFIGDNQGAYRNIGFGRFEYVGEQQGDYSPVIRLPSAQRHDMLGFNLNFAPASFLNLQSEMAFSQFDANLFSAKDDGDNQGVAYTLGLSMEPQAVSVGGFDLGRFSYQGKLRKKNTNFREIDRTTVPEFNRRWNLSGTFKNTAETIGEFEGTYEPISGWSLRGGLGRLTRADLFEANRWEVQTRLNRKGWPSVDYFVEFIDRDDRVLQETSRWLRQRGHAHFTYKLFKPIFDFEAETRTDDRSQAPESGFRFDSYTGGLEITPSRRLSGTVKYNVRDDDRRAEGAFLPHSLSKTQTYTLTLNDLGGLSAAASYIHRNRDFAADSLQDSRTDLAELRLHYAPGPGGVRGNLNYQISNTRVARQEEIFIRVEEGRGDFRFDEDFNEYVPDPFGDFVRRLVNTNDFVPVIELRFRSALRLEPGRFLEDERDWYARLLRPLSTETFVRIDEKTREQDVARIYLLDLSYFQNDTTTIFGSIDVRQDVHLWENSRAFSLRYRFRRRMETNNQFVDGGQERNVHEHGLRAIAELSQRVSSQIEFTYGEEDRLFDTPLRTDRKIRGYNASLDLVYRPRRQFDIGLKTELSLNRDVAPDPDTRANRISLIPRANYAISRRGRFRGEITWTRVLVSPADRLIPFELAEGFRAGTSFRWNFGFDYRISQNVQASLSYFGRSEPDRPTTQHIAKVEMRAFF